MSRYTRKVLNSGESAWDSKANDNTLYVYDRPYPPYKHGNTLANLQSTYPAATHEFSLSSALYKTGGGDTIAFSDATAHYLLSNWKWMRHNRTSISSGPYTVLTTDDLIETTGSGSFTIDLPAIAATNEGRALIVKQAGTGTITIDANGSDTIDGAGTLALSLQYEGVLLISNGNGLWHAFPFGATSPAIEIPLIIAASDETTVLTTGAAKVTFRMPFAYTVTEVRASLTTVSSSGLVTVDINEGGTTILSTKITIDVGEKTSTTAVTAPVISDPDLADDAEITIDIDVAGTGAAGLKITLIGSKA